MADSKLLKILAKIASQLTDLKDVITITEPCAPRRSPPPVCGCHPSLLASCCHPVPESLPTNPCVYRSADAAEKLKAAGINIHLMDELKANGAKAPAAPTAVAVTSTAVLMYTSGTTGNPKGVLISHKAPPPTNPNPNTNP